MILVLTIDDGMELGWLDGTDEGFGFDDKARNGRRGRCEKACTYVDADVEAMHDMHVEHVETTTTATQHITSHPTSDDGVLEGTELGWLVVKSHSCGGSRQT
jgi:hypothetical protein